MANPNWIGNAVAVRHVDTITVGGTYATGDTITITGLSKAVTLTVGSLVTTTQIATSLQQAWSSQAFTDTTASVSPLAGGTSIPEFNELAATVVGSTLVLTGKTLGKPMPTFTVSKVSTSGTIAIAHTVAATGPNHWDNTANWDTGSVPVTGDNVTIDRPVSIWFGLAQSGVTLASLTITQRFDSSATLGLPARNLLGYEEYRATELAIGATVVNINTASGLIKINFGSVQTTTTVYATGTSQDTGRDACQLRGTHASNALNVINTSTSSSIADVGWGANNETATVATVRQDCGSVTIGQNVTLTTFTNNGGTANIYNSVTTLTCGDTVYLWAGTATTITINNGTVFDLTATTTTTLTLNNSAVYNSDGNVAGKTITTCNGNDSTDIVDTAGRLTFTNPPVRKGRISFRPN